MSRSLGNFNVRNEQVYYVYESDEAIKAVGQLPQISRRQMDNLFTEGRSGNRTTIWCDQSYRLDKQNNDGTVNLYGFQGEFNNLSLQSGDASLAVLYIQDGFAGIDAEDVAGFRAPFSSLNGGRESREDVQFLRMLYTWLLVSNQQNKKYCITTRTIRTTAQDNPAIADAAKLQAKNALPNP